MVKHKAADNEEDPNKIESIGLTIESGMKAKKPKIDSVDEKISARRGLGKRLFGKRKPTKLNQRSVKDYFVNSLFY